MTVYGFARLADDIGDEAPGDRSVLLDWLEGELEAAQAGAASHPLMVRLGETLAAHDLSTEPFAHLIEANRQDQVVERYETFEELRGYCMLSAAPVGRIVLALFGAATPERVGWSDDVCVALQVVEHLQDVAEDARAGRVYLPQDLLARHGCGPGDLQGSHAGPGLRAAVAELADRAGQLLEAGRVLARSLPLRPALAVAGFTAGGRAALDALGRARYDVLGVRCSPRPAGVLGHLLALAPAALLGPASGAPIATAGRRGPGARATAGRRGPGARPETGTGARR